MEDLKLYANTEQGLESLVHTGIKNLEPSIEN